MNVQAPRIMNVTPTHCVATMRGPTSVDALVDIRVMVKTAQVFMTGFVCLSATREKDVYSAYEVKKIIEWRFLFYL